MLLLHPCVLSIAASAALPSPVAMVRWEGSGVWRSPPPEAPPCGGRGPALPLGEGRASPEQIQLQCGALFPRWNCAENSAWTQRQIFHGDTCLCQLVKRGNRMRSQEGIDISVCTAIAQICWRHSGAGKHLLPLLKATADDLKSGKNGIDSRFFMLLLGICECYLFRKLSCSNQVHELFLLVHSRSWHMYEIIWECVVTLLL